MPSNEYMKAYMAKRREDRRNKLVDLSGGQCERCKSTEQLEFNHKDRFAKSFTLSGAGLDRSWKSIVEEHAKCELLCVNCHVKYTQNQYKSGEIKAWNKDLHGEYVHGTVKMYQEQSCKCELCKSAKRKYRTGNLKYNEIV